VKDPVTPAGWIDKLAPEFAEAVANENFLLAEWTARQGFAVQILHPDAVVTDPPELQSA
jgi:hypothetical protein